MTDQEIIERLAEFMGWGGARIDLDGVWMLKTRSLGGFYWNPLKDWNHWRQVELKIMEDAYILRNFFNAIPRQGYELCEDCENLEANLYLLTDLPARCKALISILPPKL